MYSILPESKEYLKKDGWSDQNASLVMMGCFVGGFFGIQAISRLLHQFIPSHVVDCDHSHADAATHPSSDTCTRGRTHSHSHSHPHNHHGSSQQLPPRKSSSHIPETNDSYHGDRTIGESTPLIENRTQNLASLPKRHASARGDEMVQRTASPLSAARERARTNDPAAIGRRPSLFQVQKRVMSFVKDTKCNCDELGSCYGYTDPCGQECFKHINNRPLHTGHGHILKTTTGPFYPQVGPVFPDTHQHDNEAGDTISPHFRTSRATSRDLRNGTDEDECESDDAENCTILADDDNVDDDPEAQHHHHVPTNAFLSIGLQTSIAIALHKFPEGFITYATNHANPSLGFSVFLALFVHNISEGFAMALPLYMALGSRWKAMALSAVLGGLSQPLGAAIAVLWFKLSSSADVSANAVSYACLFAITAGIMVSVALQLFVESLSLNHNRNLCIFFGFLGMCLLGFSNALLGHH